MIEIKKKRTLIGAEKYGQCGSCSKESHEIELYQLSFCYEGKSSSVDLCYECMIELGNMIFDIYKSEEGEQQLL